jgi:hypothetical protein
MHTPLYIRIYTYSRTVLTCIYANIQAPLPEGFGSFNPTVTIQGRLYHAVGAVLGQKYANIQNYIHDSDYELLSATSKFIIVHK